MPGTEADRQRRDALIVAGVLALTVAVYANAFRAGFLAFDDPDNVLDNYSIRALHWANLEHFWTTPLQYMYTPLVSLSYALDYQVGGLSPVPYHVTNLILHLVNVVLVHLLCRAVTKKAFIAHTVTVAFALHPVNADTVCWISTRSTLLSTAFCLATLLSYLRYARHTASTRRPGAARWGCYALTLLVYALAVLSKSTAVALVLFLPVLDYCRRGRFTWWLVVEKVPFGAVALAGGLLTLHFRVDTGSLYHYTVIDRVLLVCSALTWYLVRSVVPYPLAFAYAYPAKTGAFLPWYVYLTPVILALVVFLLYRSGISRRLLLFGLSFFGLNVVLSQVPLLEDNYTANRYVYLPYVGLFLIAAELLRRLVDVDQARRDRTVVDPARRGRTVRRGRRDAASARRARVGGGPGWRGRSAPAMPALLALVLVAFAVVTFTRGLLWTQPIRVLDDSIRHQPDVPFVYNSRGITEYQSGDDVAARRDFEKTIAMDPTFTLSFYYLGVLKNRGGDHRGALADLDKALSLSPGLTAAYDERGAVELALQDYDSALRDLSWAITSDAYFVDAYLNRARVYAALRRYPEAAADDRRAIQLYPDYPDTHNDLGVALLASGDPRTAITEFTAAIQLDPRYGEAYAHRAEAERQMNDTAGACADWRTAMTYGYPAARASLQADCPKFPGDGK